MLISESGKLKIIDFNISQVQLANIGLEKQWKDKGN